MPLRSRVFALLDGTGIREGRAAILDIGMAALIVANVIAVVIETVPEVGGDYPTAFAVFETVSLAIFGVEYALRLWSCTGDPRFAGPVRGRLRCALRPMMIVDLLAVLPGLLTFAAVDLRVLRSLRLLRLVRVFKLGRYSSALQTFARVLKSRAPELASTLFVMLLLLVMASSLMYFLERDDNPKQFSSIPAAMWWGIATFTTVGYGDITPITAGGRLLGGVVAILGIAMFAIPAGLLGAAFTEEMTNRRQQQRKQD